MDNYAEIFGGPRQIGGIMMLKIAVCDDDKILSNELVEIIEEFFRTIFIEQIIDVFYDGSTLANAYKNGERFDIILMDIEMKFINGIEVAKTIRKIDRNVILIYVSGHDTYLLQLFEVEPFRFIKKPINKSELNKALESAYNRIVEKDIYFEYQFNKCIGKVLLRNIRYFESLGRIVKIYDEKETHKFYGKLDVVEERVSNGKIPFLRIHKSYLVNFHYIDKFTYTKVILNDRKELQISKDRQRDIRKRYMEILGGNTEYE